MITSGLAVRRLGAGGRSDRLRGSTASDETTESTYHFARRIEQLESETVFRGLLLEEIIHRTKNTLQLAISILGEHADSTSDAWTRHIVWRIQKQVFTLYSAHEQFYKPSDSTGCGLGRRIAGICASIRDSFGERADQIGFAFNLAEIPLERHQEICLSLILQELLTNAFKHAFPCRSEGAITIDLGIDDHSVCHLMVRDDGIERSLPFRASTGLRLVEAFASGLHGMLSVSWDEGTIVKVSFPLSK